MSKLGVLPLLSFTQTGERFGSSLSGVIYLSIKQNSMTTTEPAQTVANPSTAHAAMGHSAEPARNTGGEELPEGGEIRIYEVGYLLLPTTPEADVPREVTALKDILDQEKAAIIAEEFPKSRPLAYLMRKHIGGAYQTFTHGYFGWVKFEAAGNAVTKIEAALRRHHALLRFLLLKTVRENTMSGNRPPRQDGPRLKRDIPTAAAPSAPVSEAELDKSIEKLIAE